MAIIVHGLCFLIHPSLLGICSTIAGFEKVEGTQCHPVDNKNTYENVEKAKEVCAKDSNCVAVWNENCQEHHSIGFCSKTSTIWPSYSKGCIYKKGTF